MMDLWDILNKDLQIQGLLTTFKKTALDLREGCLQT